MNRLVILCSEWELPPVSVLNGGLGSVPLSAATLLETPAQGSFRTQNPRAPLPLRAGMEAENAITTASPMVYNI